MNFKLDKRKICIAITLAAIIALLLCEIVGVERFFSGDADERLIESVEMTLTRAIGGVVFLTILVYLGYKVIAPFKKPFWRGILVCLPAFAVAVNNFPIQPVALGLASITASPPSLALFAFECLMVAFFEETCFRGVVFLGFLNKRRYTASGRFLAIILSSAVFAVVHLFNVFFGASLPAVILQIGYSFLIGAMCAVVLVKTSNIWVCILIHAIYNFGGAIIENCGEGKIWNPVSITLTAAVAVAVTVYMTLVFFKIKDREVDRLFETNVKEEGTK